MSNGEKVPPVRVEMKIQEIGVFENVMVVGENHPHLILLAVPDEQRFQSYAHEHGIDPLSADGLANIKRILIDEVNERLSGFPRYVRIKDIILSDEIWTPENGLLTSSLKKKREAITNRFKEPIAEAFLRTEEHATT